MRHDPAPIASIPPRAGEPAADPDTSAPDPDAMLDEGAVAELLALSVKTLQAWRLKRSGGPPWVKIGSRVRYRRRDLLTYIDANTVRPD